MHRRFSIAFCAMLCSFSFSASLAAHGYHISDNSSDSPSTHPHHHFLEKNSCTKLTGRAVRPHDPQYDSDRLVSNYGTSKDKFPAAIVHCSNVAEVQNAVRWAKCQEIPVRIRSGGHNHEAFSTGTGALVIDVSGMKQLHLDKERNIALVQPGLTGGELYSKLFAQGYTQVGGTCADVGISGLVLSGGMGPLLRKHGMSCDNLLALEMVDANGELIRATPHNEHKDLFWACQGGGAGNFGVVTALLLKVHPTSKVTWFNIGWDWQQPIDKVFSSWLAFFNKDDRNWFSHFDIWSSAFPSEKFQKMPVKAMGVFYGSPEEARRQLAPLLAVAKPSQQTFEQVDWIQSIRLFEDSTSVFVTDKPEYKSSGAYAKKILPPEAIDQIITTLKNSPSPLFNVLLFSLGGAASEVKPDATAYYYRESPFFLCYTTQWLSHREKNKQLSELDDLRSSLLPYADGDYIGNPDRSITNYLTAYYGANADRLRCIKRRYDPTNLFHYEQSVPPATEECSPKQE